jgi:hypothetical protein
MLPKKSYGLGDKCYGDDMEFLWSLAVNAAVYTMFKFGFSLSMWLDYQFSHEPTVRWKVLGLGFRPLGRSVRHSGSWRKEWIDANSSIDL